MAKCIPLIDVAFKGSRKYTPLEGFMALIDDEDFNLVSQYQWRIGQNNYPYTSLGKGVVVTLHHLVAGFPLNGLVVDHINRVKQDARRCNLRFITKAENTKNRDFYWMKYGYIPQPYPGPIAQRHLDFKANILAIQSLTSLDPLRLAS